MWLLCTATTFAAPSPPCEEPVGLARRSSRARTSCGLLSGTLATRYARLLPHPSSHRSLATVDGARVDRSWAVWPMQWVASRRQSTTTSASGFVVCGKSCMPCSARGRRCQVRRTSHLATSPSPSPSSPSHLTHGAHAPDLDFVLNLGDAPKVILRPARRDRRRLRSRRQDSNGREQEKPVGIEVGVVTGTEAGTEVGTQTGMEAGTEAEMESEVEAEMETDAEAAARDSSRGVATGRAELASLPAPASCAQFEWSELAHAPHGPFGVLR